MNRLQSVGAVGHTRLMVVATAIERSGPAVRAVLRAVSPEECVTFEAELRTALDRARSELDLGPAEQVLDRWWRIAAIRANPLGAEEQAQLDRARSGDLSGLWERDDSGTWTQH